VVSFAVRVLVSLTLGAACVIAICVYIARDANPAKVSTARAWRWVKPGFWTDQVFCEVQVARGAVRTSVSVNRPLFPIGAETCDFPPIPAWAAECCRM
jgi:hypothetical protein